MQDAELFRGVKGVLFDVDGTLVDTMAMILGGLGDSYEHWLGERPTDATLLGMMGVALREQMDYFGLGDSPDSTSAERCDYTIEQYRRHSDKQRLFEPALDALLWCEDHGIPTALVTSRNRVEVKDLQNDFPVTRRASAVVCSSDVAHPKPAPDSALLACHLLSIEPTEALFVGDSLFDLGCAQSAGCRFVGVTYGAGQEDSLAARNPDRLVGTPEELFTLLTQSLTLCENRIQNPNPLTSMPT